MPKKYNKVLVVIPAHNEEKNIRPVLEKLKTCVVGWADVLVVDDCSTDHTREIALESGVKCITAVFNMRYAGAVQIGIKYAKRHDYDYVIQMDADGQHLPEEIKKLYNAIKENPDINIVIGSRYLKDTGYQGSSLRKLGTHFFAQLIKIFTSQKIADPLSGFQCFDKPVIAHYAKCGNYPEYPDANLIMEMLLRGYKIKEIPVKMKLRKNGSSMHSGIIKPIKYMITQSFRCIFVAIKYSGKRRNK